MPGGSRKFQEVPGGSRRFQEVSGGSGRFWEVPGDSGRFNSIVNLESTRSTAYERRGFFLNV